MNINFLTFNMGGTDEEEWHDFLNPLSNWQMLFDQGLDEIWAICTQEDQKKSELMHALEYKFKKTHIIVSKSNKPKILNFFNLPVKYTIHLSLFLPKSKFQDMEYNVLYDIIKFPEISLSNPLDKNNSDSDIISIISIKAAIFITLINKYGQKITFVGTHFPFNPKDQYDFSKQNEALLNVSKLINCRGPSSDMSCNSDISFIFGDLNFRNIPNKGDTLTKLLNDNNNILSNATMPINIIPTCKTFKKRNYISCKECNPNKHCVKNNQCFSDIEKRNPSYCDRILYVTNNMSSHFQIKSEPKVIMYPPVNNSDHNAVYSKITISSNSKDNVVFFGYNLNNTYNRYGGKNNLVKTEERIKIKNRNAVIYKNKRGTKFIRKNNEYILFKI